MTGATWKWHRPRVALLIADPIGVEFTYYPSRRAEEMTTTLDEFQAGEPTLPPANDREALRFDEIIRGEDPAPSAWNPVTGLDPVLCRVCGQSSDPRRGKVLTHHPVYPCSPKWEPTSEDGHTSQVRDTVLLWSANVAEEALEPKDHLSAAEVLEVSVRAFQLKEELGQVLAGPVMECPRCLAPSRAPSEDATCLFAGCLGVTQRFVEEVDPEGLYVAAIRLRPDQSVTDPDWYHLEGEWWVAPVRTEPPPWAEIYHDSIALPGVHARAARRTDRTVVRLTEEDRKQSRTMADRTNRLAGYFRALDRLETLHGITSLTQAVATAVQQSWSALESAHAADGGRLFHEALGSGETCPICPRPPAFHGGRRMEALAETLHAYMANEPGRNLTVRETWLIAERLTEYRAWEDAGSSCFTLLEGVAAQINGAVGRGEAEGQTRYIAVSDVAQVVRAYRRYLADGGVRPGAAR